MKYFLRLWKDTIERMKRWLYRKKIFANHIYEEYIKNSTFKKNNKEKNKPNKIFASPKKRCGWQISNEKLFNIIHHSVQFSCSVLFDSLRPHGLQYTRPPCPSSTPRVYSNSCPLSQWCHPTISFSVDSSGLQSFPASRSFLISQFFLSVGQSIKASASFSISPSNEYSGLISFWIDWFDLFVVQGTLRSLLQLHNSKASFLQCSTFFMVQLSHPYMTTGKTIA